MRWFRRRAREVIPERGDTLVVGSDEPETPEGAALLRSLITTPTWCVDSVVVDPDGRATFRGWALAPDPTTRLGVAIDGLAVEDVRPEVDRADLARLFWYLPHAATAGFEVQSHLGCAGGDLRLSLTVDGVVDERLDYTYPLASGVLPGPEHRRRVHGSDDAAAFLLEGRSAFEKLRRSLASVGVELDTVRSVLDWGCGCGRLTRYFEPLVERGTRVTGIDVDAMNVTWSSDHLSFARCSVVGTEPPTPLERATFDLVVGISIFTHLREQDQFTWLAELRRLVSDDGVVWVTVHGPTTMARTGLHSDGVRRWLARGFADVGTNFDIIGAVADDTYYRNVFHTHDYIRREWARWFEVLAIVPDYVGNNQDLVMLRPR